MKAARNYNFRSSKHMCFGHLLLKFMVSDGEFILEILIEKSTVSNRLKTTAMLFLPSDTISLIIAAENRFQSQTRSENCFYWSGMWAGEARFQFHLTVDARENVKLENWSSEVLEKAKIEKLMGFFREGKWSVGRLELYRCESKVWWLGGKLEVIWSRFEVDFERRKMENEAF